MIFAVNVLVKIATCAVALLIGTAAIADTLIDNVNGITMNAEGRVERFNALLIGNDGKIVQVLQKRDKRPARTDFRVDGGGKTLTPGLIDAHGHVMGTGWQTITLDLSDAKSLDEAKAMIAAYATANPQRRWILGRGWNQERWGLGRFPTAAELDTVVRDRPVWLERVDGHAGWANSAAMAAAGVTAKSVSPTGGRIETSAGKPSGIFIDSASELVAKAVPAPLSKERDYALSKAQNFLLEQGITSIADMGTTVDDWMAYRRAGDVGALRVRIFSYAAGLEPMLSITGGEPTPWLYDSKLRMGGVKLYLDGALGSRGAWLKAPYADKPGERGLKFLDDTRFNNQMSRAAMDGFQLAIHAIGDAANAQALDSIADLSQTYKGDRRWRIEHAQILDPADIERFAKTGTIASMQPVHQTSDRLMAEARLGPNRLRGAYAWFSLKQSGARLAFGSDTPVEHPNPFVGLAAAISREDADGKPFGGWQPQERVTREMAFAGFTSDAAFASFAETKVGRIAPGLYADFVLLDRDPLFSTAGELRATTVLETWVGGKRVYVRRTLSASASERP
jgi:predicted amidohydrolase YtcJ